MRKLGAGLIVLLLKAGPKVASVLIKLLAPLKSVGAVKVGLAGASVAAYSYIFTWQFALIICFMLFVHESGHVWAMKRCGIKTRGFYFIPFLGGAAVADSVFPTRQSEVFVAIMGPVWGLALSAFTALAYWQSGEPLFAAAASWMAMLNLFNLLPINPLDGGRIFKSIALSIHSSLGFVFMGAGLVVAAVAFLKLNLGLFLFLLPVGVLEMVFEYKRLCLPEKALKKTIAALDAMHEATPSTVSEQVRLEMKRWAEEEIVKCRPKVPPPMTGFQMVHAVADYVIVFFALLIIMQLTAHVPGAEQAMEILKG